MKLQSLYEELHRRGAVFAPMPPALEHAPDDNPWYTRVLMGVMGWIGGLLVLGFFGALVAGLLNNALALVVLSAALFVLSYAIYRRASHNDFATQFALAASITAQCAAGFAISKALNVASTNTVALMIAFMEVALIMVMPNFLHRLLSTMFAVVALYVAASDTPVRLGIEGFLALLFLLLSIYESRLVVKGGKPWSDPVRDGLAVALLFAGVASIFYKRPFMLMEWNATPLSFALALSAWTFLATRRVHATPRIAAVVFVAAACAAAWKAPGAIAAALVMLASFASGRRALVGLAALAMLGYLSFYYYEMNFTLSQKSAVLAATGAVLLAAWWAHRAIAAQEEVA